METSKNQEKNKLEISKTLDIIQSSFSKNCDEVLSLMTFDELVLDIILKQLETKNQKLRNLEIRNQELLLDSTIKILKNIKEHESLKGKYSSMYNQCLVLLVSQFSSIIGDIFKNLMQYSFSCGKSLLSIEEKLSLSINDLHDLRSNFDGEIADKFVEKKSISFQDMQSIARAFKDYFRIEIRKDKIVNNIILAHAFRHNIVHYSGRTNEKLFNQIVDAMPRDLQKEIVPDSEIEISQAELRLVSESMKSYVGNILGECAKFIARV